MGPELWASTSLTMFLFSVVLDDSGFSKGFGFIRFGNEQEQQTAMTSMMGVSGLGGKPIKVWLITRICHYL